MPENVDVFTEVLHKNKLGKIVCPQTVLFKDGFVVYNLRTNNSKFLQFFAEKFDQLKQASEIQTSQINSSFNKLNGTWTTPTTYPPQAT